MRVRVTTHAVSRYVERVKPALTYDQAFEELRRLIDRAQVVERAPGWVGSDEPSPAYAVLCDGIVLPLQRVQSGWLATTCMTRGGMQAGRRAARNLKKQQKRTARRVRSDSRDRGDKRAAKKLGRERAA